MFRVFHKVGKHKYPRYIPHYFASALSNTIFPVQSYQLPSTAPMIKWRKILIYLYIPPVLYHNFLFSCVLLLHKCQFPA